VDLDDVVFVVVFRWYSIHQMPEIADALQYGSESRFFQTLNNGKEEKEPS
jgi:hypothetical protein